jgi:hydroxymethylbilane synthase
MKSKIVIGSRGSKLAMIQAESVAAMIKELINPGLRIEICKIATEGDRNQVMNLYDAGNTGVFIRALEEALITGKIDIAVHSLKDLPLEIPEELVLGGVSKRMDPRDTLVACSPLSELKPGSKIGTSSYRRAAQIRMARRDLEITNIRGNVDSRLRKVDKGEFDGVIVAAAAMERLGLSNRVTDYLCTDQFLPCPGQGALGFELRRQDEVIKTLITGINHLPTWQAIKAEREFLKTLGGGCSAPISCLATLEGDMIKIMGMVSDTVGQKMLKDMLFERLVSPEISGEKLAKRMLESGAAAILSEIGKK